MSNKEHEKLRSYVKIPIPTDKPQVYLRGYFDTVAENELAEATAAVANTLRQQLAAEREKVADWRERHKDVCADLDAERKRAEEAEAGELNEARKLAAEREKYQLLFTAATKDSEHLIAIQAAIKEVFAADDEYGCGFYNTDRWRYAYDKLRALAKEHSVSQATTSLAHLVEAAYKEGRTDGFDSVSATDEYNEKRWQQSESKASLERIK